jgi:glycosyltransferase involved in cell wall biosynthesis
MSRKKILFCNEASFLSTGYGTYGNEILKRLHKTGKYELAEFASYGHPLDPRARKNPWVYYGNGPDDDKAPDFNARPSNHFGEWRFNDVLLHFKPDIVVSIRDFWMDEFILRSPFKSYFHFAHMPTVDGFPQDEQWIDMYMNCDAIFSYTDWGLDVLKKQAGDKINTIASHPPGADIDVYKPIVNKLQHKMNLISKDMFIVGTVMRNQKRKLYPDLFEAFKGFLKHCRDNGNDALANKSYLYVHTSYPDVGWDIPRLLKEYGIGHKVLFTYLCRACGTAFPLLWQDARTVCPACRKPEAGLPNTQHGIPNTVLSNIVNLFDVYVQYAICEGFGMPMVEAAACGVPVMAVDYSAMSDVVRKVKGMPIKVQRLFRETETHRHFALPDNQDFIAQLYKFANLPEAVRRKKGYDARKGVETHYTWDRTAKLWEKHFDAVGVKDLGKTWNGPASIYNPNPNFPTNVANETFIKHAIINITGETELIESFMAARMLKDLNYGATTRGIGGIYFNDLSALGVRPEWIPYTRQHVIDELMNYRNNKNNWEALRTGLAAYQVPQWIKQSKLSQE